MTADLYATLGVPRDADQAAVHRAYRRASKRAHPDMPGGSGKRFALVKLAHDTLTDDARRRHYDETGEIDEKPPDNAQAKALECIASALEAVLGACMAAHKEPEQVDLAANMRRWISDHLAESAKQLGRIDAAIAKNEALGRRFSGEVMTQIISGRIAMARSQADSIRRNRVVGEDALALLKEVTFRTDPPPEYAPNPAFYRLLTQYEERTR